MTVFFNDAGGAGSVGRVVACPDMHARGLISPFSMDPRLGYQSHSCLLQNIQIREKSNIQYQLMAGGAVQAYLFGVRPSPFAFAGLAVASRCEGSRSEHGLRGLFAWMNANMAHRRAEPISIMLGGQRILAIADDASIQVADLSTQLYSFNISGMTVPERRSPGAPDGGGEADEGGGEEDSRPVPPVFGGGPDSLASNSNGETVIAQSSSYYASQPGTGNSRLRRPVQLP